MKSVMSLEMYKKLKLNDLNTFSSHLEMTNLLSYKKVTHT